LLPDAASDSDRVVRSDDGKCALWLGAVDDLWSFGKPVGRGAVWQNTAVHAGEASDPMLATGFDRKTLILENRSDKPVDVALEADFTCDGEWREVLRVQVPPGMKFERVSLPDALQAYWFRTVALGDATLSATFVYE
ncbi:MAG: hypothetical protein II622_07370, partial [Thermoguttaceae bacterium]|nr:hypothetical protein [Thermoguttaceae bacterium]